MFRHKQRVIILNYPRKAFIKVFICEWFILYFNRPGPHTPGAIFFISINKTNI